MYFGNPFWIRSGTRWTSTTLIFVDEVFGDFITGTALTGPLAGEYGEPEITLVLEVLSGSRKA
mgnify:CR=1 FL=1